jgi:hypothetical protein
MVFAWLYERVTGQPWTTTRCASIEFGRPVGAVYERELAVYTDAELYRRGDEIVTELRARYPERLQAPGRGGVPPVVAVGPNPGTSDRPTRPSRRSIGAPSVELAPQGRGRPRTFVGRPQAAGSPR